MMTSHIFSAEDNLAKTLGLTPGFTKYLTEIVSGMQLESKHIMESAIPGGKVTLSLTFITGLDSQISQNGGNTTKAISRQRQRPAAADPVSNTTTRKKKSPSRQKRDRKRFREWLDRKKELQKARKTSEVNKTVSKEPCFVQCSPLMMLLSPCVGLTL